VTAGLSGCLAHLHVVVFEVQDHRLADKLVERMAGKVKRTERAQGEGDGFEVLAGSIH